MNQRTTKRKPRRRIDADKRRWRYAHELLELTGMSASTIGRHVRGELEPPIPYRLVGKKIRVFEVDQVEAWLKSMQRNPING